MNSSSLLRDTIVKTLKKEKDFEGMVSVDFDGFYFSAVDITLPDNKGGYEVYRIAVVKHKPIILT